MDSLNMMEMRINDVAHSIDTEEEEYEDGRFKKPAFNVRRPWNTFITIDQVILLLILLRLWIILGITQPTQKDAYIC